MGDVRLPNPGGRQPKPQSFPIPTAPSLPHALPVACPPSIDGWAKSPGALYLLDAGVGFAFAHAQMFPALVDHYRDQLHFSDVVENEWRGRAQRRILAGECAAHEDAVRAQRLQAAGTYLIGRGVRLLTDRRLVLPDMAMNEVAELQSELARLEPQGPDDGANGGECATVWEGQRLLHEGQEIVILCADDDKARRLGQRKGLAWRSTPHILREMVTAGTITADQAHEGFVIGQQVCSPRRELVSEFSCPDDFR